MKTDRQPRASISLFLLESLTAIVLLLVLASLPWMAVVDQLPAAWRLSLEAEILGVLGLLTAALVLVSVLALLHTRDRPTARS
jgi:hypothetical protein